MATFGNSGAPTGFTEDSITTNYALAWLTTTPADCTSIGMLSAYLRVDSGTTNVKACVWTSAGSLLANGVSTPVGVTSQAGAYVDLTFATPPTVTPNTTYFFGFVQAAGSSSDVFFRYKAGTGTQRYDSANSYATPGTLKNSGESASTEDGWYMTYTPSGGGALSISVAECISGEAKF